MLLNGQEIQVLRNTFLMHNLSTRDYRAFTQQELPDFLRLTTAAGDRLVFPDLQENCIAILISGKMEMVEGEKLPVRTLREGYVIGAAELFSVTAYEAPELIAVSDCSLLVISASQMRSLFVRFPALMMRYISFLTGQLQSLKWEHSLATNASVESRLLQFLAQNARREKNTAVVDLPYSFATLASRLHFSRATLYRVFDSLEADGFLKRDGRTLTILKPELLPATDFI